jgi:superfamily II helicase
MFPATDLDNHLVEVPARTGARTAAAKIDGDQSAEFQEPASYGLVRYINATFGQQVLDITKRQGEPSVKPDRVLDNLRRKPMSLGRYLDHPETVAAPDRFGHRLNVSMPCLLCLYEGRVAALGNYFKHGLVQCRIVAVGAPRVVWEINR